MKIAKEYVNKSIFCVSNINFDVLCDEKKTFVESLNAKVISCFEAKSRSKESKSFRICIHQEDCDKFFSDEVWPKGCRIREWVWRPNPDKAASVSNLRHGSTSNRNV